mmetsp:Transcript_31416/g.72241  ORF Transcript_31416/g.72241 Transcript_31416/m.72241 type:complete len:207 (+) Transcript_31416:2537-3157(+)
MRVVPQLYRPTRLLIIRRQPHVAFDATWRTNGLLRNAPHAEVLCLSKPVATTASGTTGTASSSASSVTSARRVTPAQRVLPSHASTSRTATSLRTRAGPPTRRCASGSATLDSSRNRLSPSAVWPSHCTPSTWAAVTGNVTKRRGGSHQRLTATSACSAHLSRLSTLSRSQPTLRGRLLTGCATGCVAVGSLRSSTQATRRMERAV